LRFRILGPSARRWVLVRDRARSTPVIQDSNPHFVKLWRTVGKALARLYELERPKRQPSTDSNFGFVTR
jgi:hypothetical protein